VRFVLLALGLVACGGATTGVPPSNDDAAQAEPDASMGTDAACVQPSHRDGTGPGACTLCGGMYHCPPPFAPAPPCQAGLEEYQVDGPCTATCFQCDNGIVSYWQCINGSYAAQTFGDSCQP
jgi:hypothetical protein